MNRKILSFCLVTAFFAFTANAQVGAENKSGKTDLKPKQINAEASYVNETFDAEINNVFSTKSEADDLGIDRVSVYFCNSAIDLVAADSRVTPYVTVRNNGTNSQSTYDITVVSSPAGYNETISDYVTINSGDNRVVDFPDWTPASGTYTLTATVILVGDANAANDTATCQLKVGDVPFGGLVHSFNAFAAGCAGIETDGNNIYTAYWNPTATERNFDKYTMEGVFVEEFSIPGASAIRDMAYNPSTGYFYGSDVTTSLFEMDFASKTLVRTITVPVASRGILYDDDNDTFWANNWAEPVLEFDMAGVATGRTINITSSFGLAYDNWTNPASTTFWAFTSDGGTPKNTIVEYEMFHGKRTGRQIDPSTVPGYNAGIAGGLASYEKDGHAYLLANIQQDPNLIAIFYLAPTATAGVAEFNTNASVVSVFPNPSNGIFTVSADQNYLIKVFDLTGHVIQSVNMNDNNASIDLTSKNSGMYIMRLTNENGTKTVKVIKR